MNVKVLYFAGLREAVGQSSEQLALSAGIGSVGQLHAHLAARGGAWEAKARATASSDAGTASPCSLWLRSR